MIQRRAIGQGDTSVANFQTKAKRERLFQSAGAPRLDKKDFSKEVLRKTVTSRVSAIGFSPVAG